MTQTVRFFNKRNKSTLLDDFSLNLETNDNNGALNKKYPIKNKLALY